jgi:hypothetical protein
VKDRVEKSGEAIWIGELAWLPEAQIEKELQAGILKPLNLREGGKIEVPLYLVVANADLAGPGVRRLAAIFKETVNTDLVK